MLIRGVVKFQLFKNLNNTLKGKINYTYPIIFHLMENNHVSPDGKWVWNGTEWIPNENSPPNQPIPFQSHNSNISVQTPPQNTTQSPIACFEEAEKYTWPINLVVSVFFGIFSMVFIWIGLAILADPKYDDTISDTFYMIFVPVCSFGAIVNFWRMSKTPYGIDVYLEKIVINSRGTKLELPRTSIKKINIFRDSKQTGQTNNFAKIVHLAGKIKIDSYSTKDFQNAINILESWWQD